jgi:TnpA family transposase
MRHIALSLQQRTAPAHVVVQRLLNSYPSDRLSKAFTHLGRIIKTRYILRYLTDPQLRSTVQRQLNKGEYRQNHEQSQLLKSGLECHSVLEYPSHP